MIYTIDTRVAPIDWENDDFIPRTLQNAKNLLRTWQGEVPFDRYRGLDSRMNDKSMAAVQANILREVERVLMWEPDVQVVDARVMLENGLVLVEADVKVKEDNTEED